MLLECVHVIDVGIEGSEETLLVKWERIRSAPPHCSFGDLSCSCIPWSSSFALSHGEQSIFDGCIMVGTEAF